MASSIVLGDKPNPDLFAAVAESWAKRIAESPPKLNRPSQLRRFYDELVRWQERVRTDPARFEEALPFIRMLVAKVAYARAREHVDPNFETLFRDLIQQVRDPQTLRQAKLFLEAFMAFYKGLKKD